MRQGSLVIALLLARLVGAQAVVSGVVHDSIARAPLAGATVQLVAADSLGRFGRTTTSDSFGRFTIPDVPEGRYTIGFFHGKLDALGVEAPVREIYVTGTRLLRVDLAIPSATRIHTAICRAQSAPDSGAVFVGMVRDARNGAPAAGVTVTAHWLEFTFTKDGVLRNTPRRVAITGDKGWFAICDVPGAGSIAVVAIRGADSTHVLELQIPTDRLLWRELYLGVSQTGRLSGTVTAAAGKQPLTAAQVGIIGGPQTRTNERGEWTLADVPAGTRMLEVRAVGYYPEERPVDVVPDAPPIHVSLSTLRAVLDTVKVRARYLYARDRNGFMQRRRTHGAGHFLTAADIEKRAAMFVSDLFRMVPGVRYDLSAEGRQILMRSAFGDWCLPAFYLDGHHMQSLSAEDIDDWVRPNQVAGIEVYTTNAPPQFSPVLGGCGSVVIWTK